jgi:hypothetical protein
MVRHTRHNDVLQVELAREVLFCIVKLKLAIQK